MHPNAPIVHPSRYYAATKMPPLSRPPACLRYAMWAWAASVTPAYTDMYEHFYQRSRKYIERDEMKDQGTGTVSLRHVQTWYLIGMLEFKMTVFPRAWMSIGRACRLGNMIGLDRLDYSGVESKQCIPAPKDWTEREERRRTFWMCFTADRFASLGTGWAMTLDEADVGHSNSIVSENSRLKT